MSGSMPEAFDWAERYREEDTPWDLGRPHPELVRRLEAGELGEPGRALVPGCGRGHDALALAGAGWAVTALDVVDLADVVAAALAEHGGRFLVTDALAFASTEPFDLVFDHTFFCAIDPDRRADWGRMVARVLRPAGTVAALVFPLDKPADLGGPPFGFTPEDMARALPGFAREADEPAASPIAERQWQERWARFRAPGWPA